MNQFEHSRMNRMVGFTEQDAFDAISRMIENHGGYGIEQYEVEKSEQEKEIIELCRNSLVEMLSEDSEENVIRKPFEDDRIHILKEGGVREISYGTFRGGVYAPRLDAIVVERREFPVEFATSLFHELSHAYSYRALQQTTRDSVSEYRTGLEVRSRDGKIKYLQDLNEAVAQYLTRKFYQTVLPTVESLQEEMHDRKVERREPDFGSEAVWCNFNTIVDAVHEKNKDAYNNREELVHVFVKAAYDGNILPVARLVEQTYGKGAFRKIASSELY